jgi:Colicin V production protein
MFLNVGMSIWILAVLLLAILALAGWRQGGILAAFTFGGILLGSLLAVLVGKLFHPLLPHLGASDPIMAWALAPLCGFILVSIVFTSFGFKVHREVEVYYKHNAGELRNAMWQRLNTRLGICVGLLNGAAYFILISFVIFNLTYLTYQVGAAENQPFLIRIANQLGADLQSTGMARVAAAVGTLPPDYYKFSDLSGFLMKNPGTATRLADYPGLTSLWERDDMQSLVTDSSLTNALASDATVGQILAEQPVQDLLKNKALLGTIEDAFETNLVDLTAYLQTGKSAKYTDKIIGNWDCNVRVTLAWWRESGPKISASEMMAVRALWTKGYGATTVVATGDHQLFVKNLPVFKFQPKRAPDIEEQDWKGDWSADDATNYTLHVSYNGADKYLSATADALRLIAKDGKTVLIFDRAD